MSELLLPRPQPRRQAPVCKAFFRSRTLARAAGLALLCGSIGLQGCKAQQPWPLWQEYINRFISNDGRVIDHSSEDRTTSEGQAYAMFFAVVDNDRPHFEKLLTWTESNLAGGDLTTRLPSWRWGKSPDGEWKVIDFNSASDADLWMAYSLLEAGRLWREPRYSKLGKLMAERIAHQEVAMVPGLGTTLLPGQIGFHPSPQVWLLNPSYLPLPLLVYMAQAQPEGPWSQILRSLPQLIAQGSGAGFAMDWVQAGVTVRPSDTPEQVATGHETEPPIGSYDAIRVYLWLGLADKNTPGRNELLAALPGMVNILKTELTPPLQVTSTGQIAKPEGPIGFSAAVLPYLTALGQKDPAERQRNRLIAARDTSSGLYGQNGAYYDQNLALFATAFEEKRFRFDRDGRLQLKWK